MQKTELDLILQELYRWNPKLKNKEADLIKLIKTMAEAKPDTKFDDSFASALKKDLLSHRILLDEAEESKISYLLFNLKNMNQKIYVAAGSLAVLGLVALIIVPTLLLQNRQMGKLALGETYKKVAPGAFGSLLATSGTNLASREIATSNTSGSQSASKMVADGLAVAPTYSSISSVGGTSVGSADSSMISSGGGSTSVASPISPRVDSKMMLPMFSYKYVYKGDPLALSDETGAVYRRIKGDGNLSSNLDSVINTQTFGPINLSSFSDLQTSNISLSENKKLGLSINIDFREESIYIGENWLKWQSERDNCGDNQACWDSYRLKVSDIPEDSNLIAMADKFLQEKGINLEHYASAVVDNNWRSDYARSQDKNNYYVPEYAGVIYPLVVNGQSVYDQSGNLDGLRVTINLLQKAVSGVNNLTSYRFETSDYALETDQNKILSLAEKGGYSYSNYYGDTQDKVTLELGTPVKSLVRYWRYLNNSNDELLVPALIFPVLNAPDNYYGSKFVTVPLAKEMVDELVNQKNNIITPMIYDGVAPAASAGSEGVNIMTR